MSTKIIKEFFSNFSLDNIRDFVDKYMRQLIFGIILLAIVVFLAIFTIGRRGDKEKQLTIQYYRAMNYLSENKINDAEVILNKIYYSKNSSENMKTISGIRLAEILTLKGEDGKAVEIYETIYDLKKNDEFLRNLSGLAGLSLLINQNNPSNYSQIEKLIQKLSNPSNPLLTLVNEQEGMFEIQRGNREVGLKILDNLLKQDLDEDTRLRVKMVINVYGDENI